MDLKEVIISHDSDSIVYLVPDIVADNLRKYCLYFGNEWIWQSSDAAKYRIEDEDGEVCAAYNGADFIDYLNEYAFPEEKSVFVKNLGWTDFGRNLPAKYKDHPYFNF